jgi:glycosyltransferase involved in cell wall biosynthesis
VSYWGAPVSSLYSGPTLIARRIQYQLRRHRPDHYIFESEGMRATATHGLGVPAKRTSVVPLGVDQNQFQPSTGKNSYAHDVFSIDPSRKVVFYSGHMEKRKGVLVIIKAAKYLVESCGRSDLHFLFLGNKNGEERDFDPLYKDSVAKDYITFGGYRDDIAALQASSHIAVIASTGWDSHTMTSLEVAASGLPLLVSDIPGLREVVTEETGGRFTAGDHVELAKQLIRLADDEGLRESMGRAGRARILAGFTVDHQVGALKAVLEKVHGGAF